MSYTEVRPSERGMRSSVWALAIVILLDSLWRRRGRACINFFRDPIRVWKFLSKALFAFCVPLRSVRIAIAGYAWLRCVDDVFDNDSIPPWACDRDAYLNDKETVIEALRHGGSPIVIHPEDRLIEHVVRQMDTQGIDIRGEIVAIWDSMLCVERLRCSKSFVKREEIIRFTNLDDAGAVGSCVKVFGGDAKLFEAIGPSIKGVFMRIDMLCDLLEDIKKGIVHIPLEAQHIHKLSIPEVLRCQSWEELFDVPGFKDWYWEETEIVAGQFSAVRGMLYQNRMELFPSFFFRFLFIRKVLYGGDAMLKRVRNRL